MNMTKVVRFDLLKFMESLAVTSRSLCLTQRERVVEPSKMEDVKAAGQLFRFTVLSNCILSKAWANINFFKAIKFTLRKIPDLYEMTHFYIISLTSNYVSDVVKVQRYRIPVLDIRMMSSLKLSCLYRSVVSKIGDYHIYFLPRSLSVKQLAI